MVPVLLTFLAVAGCLFLALSGCLGTETPTLQSFTFVAPHGFSAVVRSVHTDTIGYINLSGPVQLADGSGSLVDVYLYEQAIPFEGEYQRLYHYLDGDLRQNVFVLGCGYMLFGCESYKSWRWDHAGRPGPDGLGFPNLMSKQEHLLSKDAGHETRIPSVVEIDGRGRLVLTVEPPWAGGEVQEYRYTQGRALPDGWRFTVERYEDHGPLSPIEARALPAPPLPVRPWPGIMFPGENKDQLQIGVTHAEIAAYAFPEITSDPAACIQRYEIQPKNTEKEPEDIVPITIPPNQEVTAKARVAAVQGNTTIEKEVVVLRDSLNGSISMTRTAGQRGQARLPCDSLYKSPWPQTDFDGALSVASETLSSDKVLAFTYELGFMARNRDQDPEHGLHTYRFELIPSWLNGTAGIYDPYSVHLAVSGPLELLSAVAHPNVTFER